MAELCQELPLVRRLSLKWPYGILLKQEHKDFLKANAWRMKHNSLVITLRGLASRSGSVAFNDQLAEKRAETVEDFLALMGVSLIARCEGTTRDRFDRKAIGERHRLPGSDVEATHRAVEIQAPFSDCPAAKTPKPSGKLHISGKQLERILTSELKLKGNNLPLVKDVITYYEDTGDFVTAMGLIGVIKDGTVVSAASGFLSVVGALLWISKSLIWLKDVCEWGLRMSGLMGIAWGTVASAFDDAMPTPDEAGLYSLDVRQNHKLHKAYTDAFKGRQTELDRIVAKSKFPKKPHQLALRLVGGNTRQGLNEHLIKSIEKTLDSGTPTNNWRDHAKYNKYPQKR